ncbi:MAG: hypothetical protein HY235_26620 [Acidobacteria bacterium]|nr:hypothetical protein [Acidobacteriota bacterium]
MDETPLKTMRPLEAVGRLGREGYLTIVVGEGAREAAQAADKHGQTKPPIPDADRAEEVLEESSR